MNDPDDWLIHMTLLAFVVWSTALLVAGYWLGAAA